MAAPDSRTLPLDALNERRLQAVRLRLEGVGTAAIMSETGLSAPTVGAAYKAFIAGGWSAVPVRPRGRRQGSGRRLSAAEEAALFRLVTGGPPERAGLAGRLWDCEALRGAVATRFGHGIPARTATFYLQRWGASTPRPRGAAAPRRQAEDRETYWLDETRFRLGGAGGETAKILRAVTNRGKLFWLGYSGELRVGALAEFAGRLAATRGRPIRIVLSGPQWRFAADLTAALAAASQTIDILALPEASRNGHPAHGDTTMKHLSAQSARPSAGEQLEHPSAASLTHLQRLEAESIHIMREVVAEAENPVMLYSIGKDSAVMLHLALKAFFPGKPPFPLLHVDTTWKFRDMYAFRDRMVKEKGLRLITHVNEEGLALGINPFTHGSALHTDIMKTQGLKQALDKYGFDAAFGGARRDEEKSRAKERIFSFRTAQHRWDPKTQRPELWKLYNARKNRGESMRVFPLSNWTELDIWQYIYLENIPIVPLYYARERPVVERDGTLIMVDDERMKLRPGEVPLLRKVRFRTLGCYPLTGAIESDADTLPAIIHEMLLATTSERSGRVIDHDSAGSMEKKKQEGYF
jgi:sulfate adenylyltransferase subunit 2